MAKKASAIEQVKVRMRADQKRKLERAAERNGLTLNAEILHRLEQTLEPAPSGEMTVAFRMIENAIEMQKSASGDIPQDAGAAAQVIVHSLAHLLTDVFSDFRSIRLAFGRRRGKFWEKDQEEYVLQVRAQRDWEASPAANALPKK